jgi:hypothetical protein
VIFPRLDPDGHPADVMDDASRWLTYPELAEARGISRLSAERLVRRRKWQRRQGNDGTTRIAVPAGEDVRPDNRPDDRANISSIVRGFEAGLAAMREQLAQAHTQVVRERARADQLQVRVQALELEAAVERAVRKSWFFRKWLR